MPPREMTEHEKAITLYSEPIPGTLKQEYWVHCGMHGVVGGRVKGIKERTAIVNFHLRGWM